MRDMFRYLFRPSTNDPEAVKSTYYESVGPTKVTMYIPFVTAVIFLTLTFVYPPYFGGTTVFYHQLCYIWLLLVVVINNKVSLKPCVKHKCALALYS